MARKLLTEPCSFPLEVGSTRWDISDCMAGPAMPHKAIKGIAANAIHPREASANAKKARKPKPSPDSKLYRSPKRFTNGPTSRPDARLTDNPTAASESPMVRSLHP